MVPGTMMMIAVILIGFHTELQAPPHSSQAFDLTTVWLLCVDWSGGMHYDLNLIQHADDCNLPYLIAFAELDKGWLLSDH